VRPDSSLRDHVTADGSSGYPAEAGRYHLYVSLACPWAHRTIIVRRLKRLEGAISLSIVDPIRDERGWAFTGAPGTDTDDVNGFRFLAEAYRATDPGYDGRVTVPVLWDRVTVGRGTTWRCGPGQRCLAMTACGGCSIRPSPDVVAVCWTSASGLPSPTT